MADGGNVGWTVGTLKEYVDSLIKDRDTALNVALMANEKRLDSMNQIREQLNRQAGTFLTRVEYAARLDQLNSEISRLRERMDQNTGGSTATQRAITFALAVAGAAVGFGTLIFFIVSGR